MTSIPSTGFPESRFPSPFRGLDSTESDLEERSGAPPPALDPLRGCPGPLEAFERGAGAGRQLPGLPRRARGAAARGKPRGSQRTPKQIRRGRERDAGVAPASLEAETHRVSPGTAKTPLTPSSLTPLSSPAASDFSGSVGFGFFFLFPP